MRKRNARRTKSSPLGDFNGVVINPSAFTSNVTAASSILSGSLTVDATSGTASASSGGTSILNNYSEYRYKQLTLEWSPAVGPGASASGAKVYVAYIDNPEQMAGWLAGTNTQNVARIKLMRNTQVFNAWENFIYKVPLSFRKPWFDVNLTNDFTVDVLDRSTQGMVIFAAETVGATDTIGAWRTCARIVAKIYQASLST